MSDIIQVADLEKTKLHNTFHVEAVTGKEGGLAGGADIDFTTNAVTGQVQKTLPKILADIDWSYVGLFAGGVTFTKSTDFALDAVGIQWVYAGAYPFTATAGTIPSEPLYQVVHVRDHNSFSNINAAGAHDSIYSRVFYNISEMIGYSAHVLDNTYTVLSEGFYNCYAVVDYVTPISLSSGLYAKLLKGYVDMSNIRDILRRSVNAKAYIGGGGEWQTLASNVINSSKKTTTDGSNTVVWEPDGISSYNACWIRDMSMAMEWSLDYFSADEIKKAFEWYLGYANTASDYQVPDHIGLDGTVYWTPGSTNNWGARAPIDGNTYLLQMCWLHYIKTGNTTLYNTHKQDVINLLEVGVSVDINGVINVPDDAGWYTCFGFQDTIRMSGVVAFGNCLLYQAYQRLADMSAANGDNYNIYLVRAETIKNYINVNLFQYFSCDSSMFRGKVGFYKAASNKCQQQDAWASCFASYIGMTTESIDAAISANLYINTNKVVSGQQNLFVAGAMRHVPRDGDFNSGVAVWEAYQNQPGYNIYQNGAYWTTPIMWAMYSLSKKSPSKAKKLLLDCLSEYHRENWQLGANHAPAEWWKFDFSTLGVLVYMTSAAVIMAADVSDLPLIDRITESKAGPSTPLINATYTLINFKNVVLDDFKAFDNSAGNYKFVTPEKGIYDISVCVSTTDTLSGTLSKCGVFINGMLAKVISASSNGSVCKKIEAGSCRLTLSAGDEVSVKFEQNTAGTATGVVDAENWFSITKAM